VSQDEQPFPPVRRADFSRAEYSALNLVTKTSKVSPDLLESEFKVPSDILEEAKVGV
jgi:hypothetical protein